MKRVLLLVGVLCIAAALPASAELLPSFGLKAGANFSNVNLDDLESSNRTGLVGGLFVVLPWPGLTLQGEVLYTTKGFKEGTMTSREEFDFRMHDIQVPVLVKVPLPIPAVSPSLYVGPALSVRVKGEVQDEDGDWVDIKDDLKSTSWSLVFGADLTIMRTVVLDFRYDLGLSALSDTPLAANVTDVGKDIKDRTFTVMAGVRF